MVWGCLWPRVKCLSGAAWLATPLFWEHSTFLKVKKSLQPPFPWKVPTGCVPISLLKCFEKCPLRKRWSHPWRDFFRMWSSHFSCSSWLSEGFHVQCALWCVWCSHCLFSPRRQRICCSSHLSFIQQKECWMHDWHSSCILVFQLNQRLDKRFFFVAFAKLCSGCFHVLEVSSRFSPHWKLGIDDIRNMKIKCAMHVFSSKVKTN